MYTQWNVKSLYKCLKCESKCTHKRSGLSDDMAEIEAAAAACDWIYQFNL